VQRATCNMHRATCNRERLGGLMAQPSATWRATLEDRGGQHSRKKLRDDAVAA
jgi:hypothetical protein